MTGADAWRFSLAGFAVALVTVGVGTAAGLAAVPVVGSYLGTLVGGFVAGLAVEDRPLPEAGVAGVLAGLAILVAGTLVGNGIVAALVALASVPPGTLLVSAALNFAVGAFGAHFGDDLRDGLTEPLGESPGRPTTPGSAERRPGATESAAVERAAPESAARRSTASDSAAAERADAESTDGELEETGSREVELEGPERERD